MKLICLGSSSKGNCYILKDDYSAIIIEAGVPFYEVSKALEFDLTRIKGLLLTHSHGDHNKYIKEYINAGIHVYAHADTLRESGIDKMTYRCHPIQDQIVFELGETQVLPFALKHDVTCMGFLFQTMDGNTFPFITDTHYVPFRFPGMTNIIIECNYSLEIMNMRENLPDSVARRVLRSHIELDTCKNFLMANDLRHVNNIVLIHLSDGNSNAEQFKIEIGQLTGKTVHIADKGMKINLSKYQF